jgi:hypothetical protein
MPLKRTTENKPSTMGRVPPQSVITDSRIACVCMMCASNMYECMNLWILEWHKSYRYISIVHEYMSVFMWVSLNIVCACIYIYNLLACLCVSIRPFLSYFSRLVHSVSCLRPHTLHTHTSSLTTHSQIHTQICVLFQHTCAPTCARCRHSKFF